MEKLFVIYNDNSKLTVTKKQNDTMLSYFHRKVGYRPNIKSAIIQRYPKNKHEPIILISEGKRIDEKQEDVA